MKINGVKGNILLFFLSVRPTLAHDGPLLFSTEGILSLWSLDPWIIGSLLSVVFLYILGWRALFRRTGIPKKRLIPRAWLFGAGIGALVLALLSPIDVLAEDLFSAHMVQHTLLLLVAAPLLVLSLPLPAILLGLPPGVRRAVGSGWRKARWLRGFWRLISQPLVAWLLQAGLLWAWHAPGLFQAAVENEVIHALEHLSFLGSALLFWWVIVSTFGRRHAQRGVGILYLFTAALQGGLLGALLTFSPRVWYPIYIDRGAAWGLSALADQQLAGIIMWVPAGLIYILAGLLMMKSWLDAMETAAISTEAGRISENVH
jgi:putative membrane protein